MFDFEIKSILGENYKNGFFEKASYLSNILHKEGILVFNSFITVVDICSVNPSVKALANFLLI